jgi:nitroreductase
LLTAYNNKEGNLMTVMEAIETRRSVRKFADRPIEQEKLDKIAEAFRLAPSARNAQNWKLYIITSAEKRAAFREARSGSPFIADAPAILLAAGTAAVTMPCGHRADSVDLSIALSLVMLEAEELGLGTCWIGSHDENVIRKALGLPEGTTIPAVMPLGYPDEAPAARPRKDVSEVVEYL